MEAVHRRLVVDAVDRNGRARQYEKIDRPVAEDLVGDVHIAALRVASARNLRHG